MIRGVKKALLCVVVVPAFLDMKPVPGSSADVVAHIVAYVRSLQRRAGIH